MHATPSPYNNVVSETSGVIALAKFFQYRVYFSVKPAMIRGEEGDRCEVKNRNKSSIPGLVSTTIPTTEQGQELDITEGFLEAFSFFKEI